MNYSELLELLESRSEYSAPETTRELSDSIQLARSAMRGLSGSARPADSKGEPGGLVFPSSRKIAIVPDLHARTNLLPSFLKSNFPDHSSPTVAELLLEGELSVVCLGDIPHSEGALAGENWRRILEEVSRERKAEALLAPAMDTEMGRTIVVLDLVLRLLAAFPSHFFCLKGNHDNMANLDSNGDSQFYKYALEGAMGASWFALRYGVELLGELRDYELDLPLVASGKRCGLGFCASHAEPAFPLRLSDILDYRTRPDIVRALIWTPDGGAENGAVESSLDALLAPEIAEGRSRWIAGHRPIQGAFRTRSNGRFVQIHNPGATQIAVISPEGSETGSPDASRWKSSAGGGKLEVFEVALGGGELRTLAALGLDPTAGKL